LDQLLETDLQSAESRQRLDRAATIFAPKRNKGTLCATAAEVLAAQDSGREVTPQEIAAIVHVKEDDIRGHLLTLRAADPELFWSLDVRGRELADDEISNFPDWPDKVEELRATFGSGTRFDVAREWLRDYMLDRDVPDDTDVGDRLGIDRRTVGHHRPFVRDAGLAILPVKAVVRPRGGSAGRTGGDEAE
jgi:hypothetical protein